MDSKFESKARERGFTLIEVLVSLVVFSVCVAGLARLYVTVSQASAFARRATEALALASDKLETLRTAPGAAATSGQERVEPDRSTFADAAAFDGANGFFRRVWTATPNPLAGTVDLAVSVAWVDASGDPRNLALYARRAP